MHTAIRAVANEVSGPIESENPVTNARNRVERLTKRLANETHRVEEIADTMFGSDAPSEGSNGARPTRAGESGILHDNLDDLEEGVRALERQIDRLTTLARRDPSPAVSR